VTTIQIQIDDKTKIAADSLFKGHGLNIESALIKFISIAVKQKSIPFSLGNAFNDDEDELEKTRQKRLLAKGSLKGKVWMSDDFDAPLEEMEEYM
jgi:addiction module RelB/DinJ family antitoxin